MASSLKLLLLSSIFAQCHGSCAMTQRCVNPDNILDYDKCIPEAYIQAVDPQPMIGEGWSNSTGGGVCQTEEDCHNRGHCINEMCVCENDGMVSGPHCDEFALQCPEYKDAACCSWQQNRGLAENFKLLASVFGRNSAGGCDACAANLMALWCGLICSPDQSKFMRMHGSYPSINYRRDPMTGAEHVKVLEMDVTLERAMTCSLFDSCKNTAIASLSEAMKFSLGFLNYQAQTGSIAHGQFLYLHFSDQKNQVIQKKPFRHSILPCSNYSPVSDVSYLQKMPSQAQRLDSIASANMSKQCPCGACRDTCTKHTNTSHPYIIADHRISIFDGFNYTIVLMTYLIIVIIMAALTWRNRR